VVEVVVPALLLEHGEAVPRRLDALAADRLVHVASRSIQAAAGGVLGETGACTVLALTDAVVHQHVVAPHARVVRLAGRYPMERKLEAVVALGRVADDHLQASVSNQRVCLLVPSGCTLRVTASAGTCLAFLQE
jgi:hypothetical protein